MASDYFGVHIPLSDLSAKFPAGPQGLSLGDLKKTATCYGFVAEGYRGTVEALALLGSPAILHVESRHFVLFTRVVGDKFEIFDPAWTMADGLCLKRLWSREDLSARYGGALLTIETAGGLVSEDD